MTYIISVSSSAGISKALVDDQDSDLAVYKWHMSGGKTPPGVPNPGKYVATHKVVAGKQRTIMLHRVIAARMGLVSDPFTTAPRTGRGRWAYSVDHENGDKMDNRRSNLRLRDRPSQMSNPNDSLRSTNKSGFRGVSYVKSREKFGKPWMAYVTVNYVTKNLGWYATKEEAAEARRKWDEA